MVKVSVIIPNYNRAPIVGDTIENMLRQSLPPHEIIVVDDGSTDNSVDVIRRFGDRVQLISQANKGPGAARNAGLKIAAGQFIQLMDSDDLASLNKLEIQANILIEQNADIAYGPWAKVWIKPNKLCLQDVVVQQRPLPQRRTPLEWFLTGWSMVFQQCLIRRSLLERVGGYREDIRLFEDGDLLVKLLLAGGKFVHEKESLTLYRLNDFDKLTGSGQQQAQRAIDQAHFFLSLMSLAQQHPQLQPYLHHPAFQQRVWQALQDLNQAPNFDSVYVKSLRHLTNRYAGFHQLRRWLSSKYRGIQQRIQGHRWPKCYQTDLLTIQQMNLIKEMGFQLSDHKENGLYFL